MATNHNIYTLFQSCFPNDKQAVFLEHERGELTYHMLDEATGRVLALLQQLGIDKGDRIIVQVEKSAEAVILYLACLRAGAIFIPLNTAYTAAEVAYFMEDAKPQLVVCGIQASDEIASDIERLAIPHVLTLDSQGSGTLMDQLADKSPVDDKALCDGDDLACILYTSGTTGRSKGAMLSHDNLSSNAQVLHQYWQWEEGDVLLHALPIFHVHGLFVALHCALLNASKVIFLSTFDVGLVKKNLPRSTVMMGVPTFYVRLLDDEAFTSEESAKALCRNMRLFIAGSAPLLSETLLAFEKLSGHRILERYGMTEAGMITSNPYNGERIPATVGFPLPGVRARVADEQGKELPRGKVGVLEITGPNVFQGYWCMPEKTVEEFRDDGYFITGDMAVMDENDRVSIVGRAKDLVISGGYNVYPKEVETVIDDLDGVKESAVIGVPHADYGEGVTAIIVKEENASLNETDILALLTDKLANFKRPKRIFFIEALPRNTMGKVQKNTLRESYHDIYS